MIIKISHPGKGPVFFSLRALSALCKSDETCFKCFILSKKDCEFVTTFLKIFLANRQFAAKNIFFVRRRNPSKVFCKQNGSNRFVQFLAVCNICSVANGLYSLSFPVLAIEVQDKIIRIIVSALNTFIHKIYEIQIPVCHGAQFSVNNVDA